MKKVFSVVLFLMIMNCSFSQEYSTLMRLHELSVSLGSTSHIACDTLILKARVGKMDIRTAEQLVYLLRAAEFYSLMDYANSVYYIKKVGINYRYPDYYNLKLLLLIGNSAHLNDLDNTAKYFYIMNKVGYIDPQNLITIRTTIRNNFKKEAFFEALSHYYYYHQRLKQIEAIGFVE